MGGAGVEGGVVEGGEGEDTVIKVSSTYILYTTLFNLMMSNIKINWTGCIQNKCRVKRPMSVGRG